MELTDCLSAFEDFLRTKDAFQCSCEEMVSVLQTLSRDEKVLDLVKETILNTSSPTFKVDGQTVSLSSCYMDSVKQIQDVLQEDKTGKLSHIMQQIRKSLGHTQRKTIGEISTMLEISGEERVSVKVCKQRQHLCEAKVKMHHYLLLEGLQDVVDCLLDDKINAINAIDDVWKSCKTSSAPLAMQKVGMNQSKFEKTLKSYPEVFRVEDGKVFLNDGPRITHSLISSHMQSAKEKLKDYILNHGPLLKKELFRSTAQLLSRAEVLAMGGGLETFTFTLLSLNNDFLLILPHMLVIAQGTSQVQENPFVSAIAKTKDFIRSEGAGNGPFMSQLLTFVNKTLDPCEQAAVGNTSAKIRETIVAYPDHFGIKRDTVFIKSDAVILPKATNLGTHSLHMTNANQRIIMGNPSSDQSTEHSEDSAYSDAFDDPGTDNDVGSSDQTSFLGQDEVESLGSVSISDSESLHSGSAGEVENVDSDTSLLDRETVTILQDMNYFGGVITEFLDKATFPILSVSLSDGWLIVGLWDGHTFAIFLAPSRCGHQKIKGKLEGSVFDFLTSKSILKVVYGEKLLDEINDALGIKMVNVFDLKMAHKLIGVEEAVTLPEALSLIGVDPYAAVEVCNGTIQAPVSDEAYSEEAIIRLKETTRWTMKQVPCLYQKILGMMTYQITEVSGQPSEVDEYPITSSSKEEPPWSMVTSTKTHTEESISSTSQTSCEEPVSGTQSTSSSEESISYTSSKTNSQEPVSHTTSEASSEKPGLGISSMNSSENPVSVTSSDTSSENSVSVTSSKTSFEKHVSFTPPETSQGFHVSITSTTSKTSSKESACVTSSKNSQEKLVSRKSSKIISEKPDSGTSSKTSSQKRDAGKSSKTSSQKRDAGKSSKISSENPVSTTSSKTSLGKPVSGTSSKVSSKVSCSSKSSKTSSENYDSGKPSKTSSHKPDSGKSSKTSNEKPVSVTPKTSSEKPISVHQVSSTSGDIDQPDSSAQAKFNHDSFQSEDGGSGTISCHKSKLTSKRPDKSPEHVTKGSSENTTSDTTNEQWTSEQDCAMVNAKVLHYDNAGKPTLISFTSKHANKVINPCQISHELSKEFGEIVMHDQEKFLEAFGICIKYNLKKLSKEHKSLALNQLTEVVMDIGRKPSARYYQPEHPGQLKVRAIGDKPLTKQDLKDFLEGHCSPVSSDHRSSIKGTLHRVGIMCNRQNEPIGITALTKHAVLGCATPLYDLMNQGQSILFVGNPGVGKSTILREAARVINDVAMRRVVIVDTCSEIAGDEDIPHPSIGGARRVQLLDRDAQPSMTREVVRNHSPQTLIIDEVVTEADAAAVLGTRQRGIQVISTAPGQTLQDVILNPNLAQISGRITNMAMNTLSGGHIGNDLLPLMQRSQPAAFDILVEMHDRYRWIVHMDFTRSIDMCLRKESVSVQERRVVMKEVSKDSEGIPEVMVQELVVLYPLY